jgi:PAS domain S-box-containing protein
MLNENGEIYYASDNIETYLGFHQSDILHQPVFDMIHSEDRDEIRQQMMWNNGLPATADWHTVCANGMRAFVF